MISHMLPITEQENPNTSNIDQVSTLEALRLINNEDKKVAGAVENVLDKVAALVEAIVERIARGGHVFYVGTGTSGRLGVLDASEVPPTFGVSYDLFQGVIAGGYDALHKATESSEDDAAAGGTDLRKRGVSENDVVIGIAASGRTPYTIGAVEYARGIGCFTACVACVPESKLTEAVDIAIVPVVGPEAITGSTRMKAGTAQKLVLNLISTAAMIRLGYVKGNRMTNVRSSNIKLKERSLRILVSETGLDESKAQAMLSASGDDLRVALVVFHSGATYEAARKALEKTDFVVEQAIARISQND